MSKKLSSYTQIDVDNIIPNIDEYPQQKAKIITLDIKEPSNTHKKRTYFYIVCAILSILLLVIILINALSPSKMKRKRSKSRDKYNTRNNNITYNNTKDNLDTFNSYINDYEEKTALLINQNTTQNITFPRVGLVSYAKREHLYINDWVKYYINIGFTHVYIIDNDEPNSPFIGDFIDKNYLPKVTILDNRVNKRYTGTYVYHTFKDDLDWLAVFDCDEYISFTNKTENIRTYISKFIKARPDTNLISFSWTTILDDDICSCLEGNTSIPVYKRLLKKKPSSDTVFRKNIIKIGLDAQIGVHDARFLSDGNPVPNQYTSSGRKINEYVGWDMGNILVRLIPRDTSVAEILHYRTKTLGEFLRGKFLRVNTLDVDVARAGADFNYFFKDNEITEGKVRYIKEKTGVDIMNDPIYQGLKSRLSRKNGGGE